MGGTFSDALEKSRKMRWLWCFPERNLLAIPLRVGLAASMLPESMHNIIVMLCYIVEEWTMKDSS